MESFTNTALMDVLKRFEASVEFPRLCDRVREVTSSFPRLFYLSSTDKASAIDSSADGYNQLSVTPSVLL